MSRGVTAVHCQHLRKVSTTRTNIPRPDVRCESSAATEVIAARTSNTTSSSSRGESTASPSQGKVTQTKGWSLCIIDATASTKSTDSRMTCAADTLASVWARSNQEVVRHGIEDWTVSTHTTD